MNSARGFTGKSLPLNSYSMMLWRISRPIEPRSVEAPITATDLGENKASSEDMRLSNGGSALRVEAEPHTLGNALQTLLFEADRVSESACRRRDLASQESEVGGAAERLPGFGPERSVEPILHRREVDEDRVQDAGAAHPLDTNLEET